MKKGKKTEEEQKFENEVKKLKLRAENNAEFFENKENDLPAEVESKWLDNIMAFEEAFNKQEVKKIDDVLGNPSFIPVRTLDDKKLSTELEKLMNLLAEHDIILDVLYDVPDREVYRFITEEFLQEEIQIIGVPGYVTHFTYEEFHPNDKEDLKRYTEEFIETLMSKNFEFMDYTLSNEVKYFGKTIKGETFVEKLSDHLANTEALKLKELEVQSIEINNDKAEVKFQLSYTHKSNEGQLSEHVDQAKLGFNHMYGYWYIESVTIPGLGL